MRRVHVCQYGVELQVVYACPILPRTICRNVLCDPVQGTNLVNLPRLAANDEMRPVAVHSAAVYP
jgi:hypothetical protein